MCPLPGSLDSIHNINRQWLSFGDTLEDGVGVADPSNV